MAYVVTETRMVDHKNGLVTLYGTAANTGGSTGGAITPGTSVGGGATVTGSSGLKKFISWSFNNQTGARACQVVKTYDATQDGEILTLTCTANDSFDFAILGEYNGTYTFGS